MLDSRAVTNYFKIYDKNVAVGGSNRAAVQITTWIQKQNQDKLCFTTTTVRTKPSMSEKSSTQNPTFWGQDRYTVNMPHSRLRCYEVLIRSYIDYSFIILYCVVSAHRLPGAQPMLFSKKYLFVLAMSNSTYTLCRINHQGSSGNKCRQPIMICLLWQLSPNTPKIAHKNTAEFQTHKQRLSVFICIGAVVCFYWLGNNLRNLSYRHLRWICRGWNLVQQLNKFELSFRSILSATFQFCFPNFYTCTQYFSASRTPQ